MNTPRRAVLLIDHGSKSAEANRVLDDLAAHVADLTGLPVRVAHMQFAEPSIDDTVDACFREGIRDVIVVPVFLAPGKHSMKDIPRMVDEAVERHSGMTCSMASPLGAHPKIAEVIVERMRQAVKD
jgi:sirohydrochlorin ferrochelatase